MSDSGLLQVVAVGIGAFALGCYLGLTWRSRHPEKGLAVDLRSSGGAMPELSALDDGMGEAENIIDSRDLAALDNTETLAMFNGEFKLVLVVRMDLKMGKGKIAAQCSHATLGIYKKLQRKAPTALRKWEYSGQRKVVLKIDTEDDMMALVKKAKDAGVPTHITIDAGRTQIAPDSRTVMAVGPAPDHVLDDITGHLKLL
ncbi:hypothetical protein CBR_g33941 [Chara braunii]|uniref:peptidyl-tRNA hydrolase n=1 Tax=Chara braunii TaxID=69332 RepID=A0A388LHQ4_CHABU|nr:hypothetical protein CBR_g33941 [Chara braunii]|eukprot:GBG81763.1 hypothetical protein CBR_g33941 [Chara braunii]